MRLFWLAKADDGMNGADKGLQLLQNKPLISHVIERLQPQVVDVSINANRHHNRICTMGFPCIFR